MAPLAVVAVTLPSARSMSNPPLALLRSRSAEAWPIQVCPPELDELDGALDLADPQRERGTVDGGAPGDVADRDLAGSDVRLQCVDAIELDLTRCHVQLALAERAVSVNARVRQVRDQAGAGGQVDRDGDRTVLVPGGGRLDRQLTAGELDLGLVRPP